MVAQRVVMIQAVKPLSISTLKVLELLVSLDEPCFQFQVMKTGHKDSQHTVGAQVGMRRFWVHTRVCAVDSRARR
jgi:hypothetical protein